MGLGLTFFWTFQKFLLVPIFLSFIFNWFQPRNTIHNFGIGDVRSQNFDIDEACEQNFGIVEVRTHNFCPSHTKAKADAERKAKKEHNTEGKILTKKQHQKKRQKDKDHKPEL